MVSIQQLIVPAIFLLGLAEQVAAAPLGSEAVIVFRDVDTILERDIENFDLVLRSLYGDELDLETRANLLGALKKIPGLVKGAAKAFGHTVKANKGKTFERVLSSANTGMNVANTIKAQKKGKRDLEDLDSQENSVPDTNKAKKIKKTKKSRHISKKSKKMAAL